MKQEEDGVSESRQAMLEYVSRCIQEVKGTPAANLVPQVALVSLDVDSLDMIEIGMLLEEHLGVRLEQDLFKEMVYLDDLVSAILALRRST